jgi:hypothetical protein
MVNLLAIDHRSHHSSSALTFKPKTRGKVNIGAIEPAFGSENISFAYAYGLLSWGSIGAILN